MDVSTFYALFSATCFTLTGLWWSVVEKHRHWLRDPGMRRRVGSVYLAFLLPALMGLFAQIGGSESPAFWRVSFVVIAVIGCASTVTLLRRARAAEGAGTFARYWWAAGGRVRGRGRARRGTRDRPLDRVTPLQAEATLLVLLVALAHALVWEFMTHEGHAERT